MSEKAAAVFGVSFTFLLITVAIWVILQIVAYWRIFEKAGKPGWHSIIPVLKTWDQFDLCWNGWYGILMLVMASLTTYLSNSSSSSLHTFSIVTSVLLLLLMVIGTYKLAKAFGHGVLFTLGLILFNPVFILILGFGNSEYIGKE